MTGVPAKFNAYLFTLNRRVALTHSWYKWSCYVLFLCAYRFDAADKGEDFDKAIKDVKKEK